MTRVRLSDALFLVISVVETAELPLSYAQRSLYSPAERLEQTLATVASIRKHAPGARLEVLEHGRRDVRAELAPHVDAYHYLGRNRLVRWSADGPHKGLGEAVCLLVFLTRSRLGRRRFVFKLSGRYRLTDAFDPSDWDGDAFNCVAREGGISTVLYGLPSRCRWRWMGVLVAMLPALRRGDGIEPAFARRLNRFGAVHLLGALGFEGEIAPTGETISY